MYGISNALPSAIIQLLSISAGVSRRMLRRAVIPKRVSAVKWKEQFNKLPDQFKEKDHDAWTLRTQNWVSGVEAVRSKPRCAPYGNTP
jgi:hypothetical protein